jgi:peptidoglycan/LPS O-acetylase OafA/YrhL
MDSLPELQPVKIRPATGKLLGVEAVRGIAALLVVLFHAGDMLSGRKDYGRLPLDGALTFGRAGVDIFFVLSGFIITVTHARDVTDGPGTRRLAAFTRKRLLRIFPSYWICTLVLLAIMQISPTPDRREHDPAFLLSSFLLLPSTNDPLLGPGWSLRHELLFYALFALAIARRRIGIAAMGLWFAAIAANSAAIMASGSPLAGGIVGNGILAPLNGEFLAGIGVAILLLRTPIPRPLALLATGLAAFALSATAEVAWPDIPPNWPPLHLAYAAATALVLLGLAMRERAAPLPVPAWLVRFGDASYALYLLHVIVIMIGVFLLRHLRPIVTLPLDAAFALLVAASVAAALLFTAAIERPLLKYLRRIWHVAP